RPQIELILTRYTHGRGPAPRWCHGQRLQRWLVPLEGSSRRSPPRQLMRLRNTSDHVPAWISAGRVAMVDAKRRSNMRVFGEGVGNARDGSASSFSS
uniref:Uncharacterized protein n=1 Tax=Triticum urartu TaxID=4572 RepID=A0A8R7UR67_TRIUA